MAQPPKYHWETFLLTLIAAVPLAIAAIYLFIVLIEFLKA